MGNTLKQALTFFVFFMVTFSHPLLCKEETGNPHLHVCTLASHEKKELEQLRHACRFRHIPLEVLGLGESFAFEKKIKDIQKYLEKIPDRDVILFVDAYDVLILANKETILDKFLSMNAPIVFSAETCCHPFPHLSPYYPKHPSKFSYLNAGGYIGYAKHLKEMYKAMSPVPDHIEDQGLLTVYYLYHPEKIKLDYECKLFLSLYEVGKDEIELDIKKKEVRCLITHSSPCIVHGNGSAQVLYQEIYTRLFSP